jgi:UDP-N-acetylmuramyl pentapeptide phosphotransferase/UDP-N-acetylglucosamine-1-phosphate transferase
MSGSVEAWQPASALLLIISSAVATAGLIVLLFPLMQRYALARPNGRSSHKVPTPQGGGAAVVAATIGSTVVATLVGGVHDGAALTPVFLAAALLSVVGAADDVRPIEVAPRLVLQALAVGSVIAMLPGDWRLVPFLPWSVEFILLLLAGMWFINLTNFMDGIDWMTVAEVVPLTAGLVLIGWLGALPPYATAVALALLGAMIGFAPFNRPIARLFLGDVGSLPIGLLLGWMLLLLAANGHVAPALILPLYYLADATVTLARRLWAGEKVWQAHRSHFYQWAIKTGFTVPEIVARVFAVNLALVALAVLTVLSPHMATVSAALLVAAGLVVWLLLIFARGRA